MADRGRLLRSVQLRIALSACSHAQERRPRVIATCARDRDSRGIRQGRYLGVKRVPRDDAGPMARAMARGG